MNTILYCILIVLVLYFEWGLVATALAPITDIIVSVLFIARLIVLIVAELALMVIAPVALILGCESREWHVNVVKKLMYGRKRNADAN